MEQLVKKIADFLLNPTFLYVSLSIIILILINLNVFIFLRKKGKITKPQKPEKRNFFNLTAYYPLRFLFLMLEIGLWTNLFFGLTFIAVASAIILPAPKVTFPIEASLGITNITADNPVVIKFDRPVNKSLLRYEISPSLEGEWKFSNPIAPNKLYFYAKTSAERDTRYQISLTNIKGLINNGDGAFLFTFQTPPIPEIQGISPENGDQGVMPNQDIVFKLSYPTLDDVKIDYQIEPPIDSEISNKEAEYKINPKSSFKKGATYRLSIYRTLNQKNFETGEIKQLSEKKNILENSFRIIEAPGVESYSPIGTGILTNTDIKINFKQDMNKETAKSAFSIVPKVDGNFSWEGNRSLIFKPQKPLEKNTKYAISISAEAEAIDKSPFEESLMFEFTTIGYVTASISPANEAKNIGISPGINVNFNQAVDHASAQSKFSISPNISGSFSWQGNKMIYKHSNFSYSSNYTITIAAGVKSINGLDSNQTFKSSFTTQAQSITLNIPAYKQAYTYSCMLSAARSALAYRGIKVSESTLYSQIAKDSTGFSGSWPNDVHWGNPNVGFVGGLNGSNPPGHGYGAHWGPTSALISKYRPNSIKSGWNVQGIASEIAAGNPVIVWWVNGVWPAYTVNWWAGATKIYAVNSMHVQVVKGFTGTVDNPTSFIVTDSGFGYPGRTFSTSAFNAKWGWFGNTAIVVY